MAKKTTVKKTAVKTEQPKKEILTEETTEQETPDTNNPILWHIESYTPTPRQAPESTEFLQKIEPYLNKLKTGQAIAVENRFKTALSKHFKDNHPDKVFKILQIIGNDKAYRIYRAK